MKSILVLFICFSSLSSFAQPVKSKKVYLIVRILADALRIKSPNAEFDQFEKYNVISVEADNPYASDIYKLVPYKIKNKANTDTNSAKFSFNEYDSTKTCFNYFKNTTQALLFLSSKGWELVSVINEVRSSYA